MSKRQKLCDEIKEALAGEVFKKDEKQYNTTVSIGNAAHDAKRPEYVVLPNAVEEVEETLKYCKKAKLQLTIKGGGHSYAGYCLNEGGVVMDMTNFDRIDINEEAMTITIGAGVRWKAVYDKLKGHLAQYMVVGGQCPTVGVSGFTIGGGLSTFSRQYGLGCDNILKMTMVDPSGDVLHLTKDEKKQDRKDLFWALCGGGGGNFGIVTEFTLQLHKLNSPEIVAGELTWQLPQQKEEFLKAMEYLNAEVPKELCIDSFWAFNYADGKEQLQANMTVIYNGTMDDCKEALGKILRENPLNELASMHWFEWEQKEAESPFGHGKNDISQNHISWIFGKRAITTEVTNKIIDLMKEAPALIKDPKGGPRRRNCHFLWDHMGGQTETIAPDATPFYWRNGEYVMNAKICWSDPSSKDEALQWQQKAKEILTPYTIEGKASYLNYIDENLDNWQYAYYGNNYDRLQQIKSRWDPDNFFHFKQGIESAASS